MVLQCSRLDAALKGFDWYPNVSHFWKLIMSRSGKNWSI